MYVYGGFGKSDLTKEEQEKPTPEKAAFRAAMQKAQAEEVEQTIAHINEIAAAKNIKINLQVINLFDAKRTSSGVLDLKTGDFFYLPDDKVGQYIVQEYDPSILETDINAPVTRVFG